jgi:hypothetical protein
MKYGLDQGKWFITFWIFMSQLNMAYCDTVTDALSIQASKHGNILMKASRQSR